MVYYGSDGAGGYLRLDRPLRTVTTLDRFAYVRPTQFGHEMRMLQPTELAAAMGFPVEHQLPKSTRREFINPIKYSSKLRAYRFGRIPGRTRQLRDC